MNNKFLTSISILFLLAIALTACNGTGTNVDAAPAASGPTLQPSPLALTDTPASASTNTPAPQATDTASTSTGSVSFSSDVMPILESRCIKCHGGESTKEGLDMKTHASLMAGSKNGSVITPGNTDDSFLIQQLLEGEMPKRGPRLTPDQIQIIIEWVNAGALDN